MRIVMQYLFNLKKNLNQAYQHIMSVATRYTLGSYFKIVISDIKGYTLIPAKGTVPKCGFF